MSTEERLAVVEAALAEIGKLGVRLAEMFPDSPMVLRTVDAFLADVFSESESLAA